MKSLASTLVFIVLMTFSFSCQPDAAKVTISGPDGTIIEFRALPFELDQVKLLDGPFKHAMDLNIESLLKYEPDRLLAKFRTEAGLEAKAEHYHGWEDNTISGHSLGHYLSACALMYKSTGDERFLERANYIVDELALCQEKDGEGFIGAFPDGKRILEEEVKQGDIRSKGFDLNGIWVPWYNEHKTMNGLRDAYLLCDNEKALEVDRKLGDWIGTMIGPMTTDQMQDMMDCEHGGINESLADLYAMTGEQKYLDLSRRFHHKVILDSLALGIDILPGKHGNTQIPKLIGLAHRYEYTGDTLDRKAAEFFWDRVVNHHSYVTGGHGNHEYFGQPDELNNRLSQNTTETCNVYNMLKLSKHIFGWTAEAQVADYYERALFNQILSSQHPEDGRVIYNMSLEMGGHKVYQNPEWFTCCVGTGMENHSKYSEAIYFHNDEELFVNQFIASELDWEEKGFILTQETDYPDEQETTLEFDCDEPVYLTLNIRYPYWAENGVAVKINGKRWIVNNEPSSFIKIKRRWKDGDKVKISFPFSLRLEPMPDNENRVAILYGPLVLAGQLGPENDPDANSAMYVPVIMTDSRNPSGWLKEIYGRKNEFVMSGVGRPRDVELKPFYTTHEYRYSVYWDVFTEAEWESKEKDYQEELEHMKNIESRTMDFVQPGEMQPERNHNFKGEKTTIGELHNRKMRESRNGWFSYDLRSKAYAPNILLVEYWGGYPGSKTFDILVDGKLIATENISMIKDGSFLSIEYPVPESVSKGKNKLTVSFKAHPSNIAGPVFGVRMMY